VKFEFSIYASRHSSEPPLVTSAGAVNFQSGGTALHGRRHGVGLRRARAASGIKCQCTALVISRVTPTMDSYMLVYRTPCSDTRNGRRPSLASAATLSGTEINTDYRGNLYRLHQSFLQRFSAEIEDVRLFFSSHGVGTYVALLINVWYPVAWPYSTCTYNARMVVSEAWAVARGNMVWSH